MNLTNKPILNDGHDLIINICLIGQQTQLIPFHESIFDNLTIQKALKNNIKTTKKVSNDKKKGIIL